MELFSHTLASFIQVVKRGARARRALRGPSSDRSQFGVDSLMTIICFLLLSLVMGRGAWCVCVERGVRACEIREREKQEIM